MDEQTKAEQPIVSFIDGESTPWRAATLASITAAATWYR
jgi:hypothetical protein